MTRRKQAAARPGLIRFAAPLTCASCARGLEGHWIEGHETAAQTCPSCGHMFDATWPGFDFEPERVIVRPSGEVVRRGAA